LVKKVVIADRLAMFVNQVYGEPAAYKGIPLIISTIFFAFQIFCDFSGYSDIARGCAKCMGYDLMLNFDRPYRSTSIGEFWRRWHISLSTWFRDYVYISLGGNRVSKYQWYFNILVVFLLSGIWHGSNWTFVIWGLLHGLYLVFESMFYQQFPQWRDCNLKSVVLLQRFIVFALVVFAWVFFRAKDVSQAFYILQNFFVGIPAQVRQLISNEHFSRLQLLYLNQGKVEFVTALVFIAVMIAIHSLQKNLSFDDWILKKSFYPRWSLYYAMVIVFVYFGVFNRSEFIYFQF
jgi:D-alanyl-lipoteichoic acid acyltransferase DltB (MBOAT superfamily)